MVVIKEGDKVQKSPPRFKQVILAIAIALVLAFFVNYSLSVIFDEPKWEKYCKNDPVSYDSRDSCTTNGGKWFDPSDSSASVLQDQDSGDSYPVSQKPFPIAKVVPGRSCPGLCVQDVPNEVCKKTNLSSCNVNNVLFEPECQSYGGIFFPFENCPNAKLSQGYCDAQFQCRKDLDHANEVYRRNVFISQVIIGLLVMIGGIALALPSVSAGFMAGSVITLFVALVEYWGDLGRYARIIILGVILLILIWLGYRKMRQ